MKIETLEQSRETQKQSELQASQDLFPVDECGVPAPQPQRKTRVRSARKVTPEPEMKSIWDDIIIETNDKKPKQGTKNITENVQNLQTEKPISESSISPVPKATSAINSQASPKPKPGGKPKDSVIERLFRSPPVKSLDAQSVSLRKPDLKPMETNPIEKPLDSARIKQDKSNVSKVEAFQGVKSSLLDSSDEHNTSREWWPTTHEWILRDQSSLHTSESNAADPDAAVNKSLEEIMQQMCSYKPSIQTQDASGGSSNTGN